MRTVVYVAPYPLETTLRFSRALAGLKNIRLVGLFQRAPSEAHARLFDHVELVDDALDTGQIRAAVRRLQERFGPIHRLLGILEQLQDQLAVVRSELGIAGPTPAVTARFRDKSRMKEALAAAGLPVAAHARLHSADDGRAFALRAGFPLVLKPPAGAGCKATFRCDNRDDLEDALLRSRPSPDRPVVAEAFVTGQEHTFETYVVGGQPVFHSIGRYYPTPLEVMRQQWVQWVVHLPRQLGPEFDDVRDMGTRAIQALGLPHGMTHMEWFRKRDGTAVIGEIAARPPGAQIVKLISYAHDFDGYRAWARAVIDEAFDGPVERKYSVGVAFLRGVGRGRITAVEGLERAQERMGSLVVEARLPQVGWPRADGYEGEGYAILRHRDDAVVKRALLDLIRTVKVRYSA